LINSSTFSNGLSLKCESLQVEYILWLQREQMAKLAKIILAIGVGSLLWAGPGLVGTSAAQDSNLTLLSELRKGEWTVRFRNGASARKICVRSGIELLQLQHTGQSCSRFVVDDDASEATVQYTCPGNGYGRTKIRMETSTLAQIESQGIVDGRPFEFSSEARHTGPC
jgi:hypothetical protein